MRLLPVFFGSLIAVQAFVGIATTTVFAAEAKLDCKSEDLNQSEMNECAGLDFLKADEALNKIYKKARDMVKSWDDDEGGGMKAFVDGQKGWIAYRDGYCTAYAYQSHGGSMEPMLISGCMTELTNNRTKELKSMMEN